MAGCEPKARLARTNASLRHQAVHWPTFTAPPLQKPVGLVDTSAISYTFSEAEPETEAQYATRDVGFYGL